MNWTAAIESTVTGLGYDLVDVERSGGGLLRVFIDRLPGAQGGGFITVDDCEKVTRQLQHVLEVEGCAYERLEVSSPGLDRPLKKPADFVRFSGEQIELTLKVAFQGRKKYRGLLQTAPVAADAQPGDRPAEAASDWRLVFDDGAGEQALDFSLQEMREARLVPVVDFKGRRFAPAPAEADAPAAQTEDREDGGRRE